MMAAAGTAYRYYRFTFKGSFVSNNDYASFSEIGMFEADDGSGVNLCTGSTATSSGSYSAGTTADKAIDGNPSTYYESENKSYITGGTAWFKIEFSSAQVVRSITLTLSPYPNEFPTKYVIEGSNNNADWVKLFENKELASATSYTKKISVFVGGSSLLSNGQPSQKVAVFDWATLEIIEAVVPASNGDWFVSTVASDVLVTHIGPSGYEPKSDGPISPYGW